MREKGYYLNIVNELKRKDEKTQKFEFLYNIISSEKTKLEAMNIVYHVGYLKGETITEYDRITQKNWINEWITIPNPEFLFDSKILLEKLSMKEVKRINIKKIIKNIEYNLEELKKYNDV